MRNEQWFIDRIGKRIFRDRTSCDCKTCKDVLKNGLIISDEFSARYIHMVQCDLESEGEVLNYRDKK